MEMQGGEQRCESSVGESAVLGGVECGSGGRGEKRLVTPGEPPDHSDANEELLRQQSRC